MISGGPDFQSQVITGDLDDAQVGGAARTLEEAAGDAMRLLNPGPDSA
jgi:hypothetical protein